MRVINEKEFKDLVSDGLVLVDFFAEWCGPCRMLAPVLEDFANEESGIEVYKVNVDNDPDLAREFKVSSIPTMILFKDGKQIEKKIGFAPKDALKAWIANYK